MSDVVVRVDIPTEWVDLETDTLKAKPKEVDRVRKTADNYVKHKLEGYARDGAEQVRRIGRAPGLPVRFELRIGYTKGGDS